MLLKQCRKNSKIDDLVLKKHSYGTREKNIFEVAVNHTGRDRSHICFNRTLYNALPGGNFKMR